MRAGICLVLQPEEGGQADAGKRDQRRHRHQRELEAGVCFRIPLFDRRALLDRHAGQRAGRDRLPQLVALNTGLSHSPRLLWPPSACGTPT
jgi:hypothetical protein